MFKKYKDRLYFKLVHTYPEVQAHYEGYKDSNPEYHRSHRLKSFKFLRQLNKYYKKGKKGDFPKPPRDYTVKGSGVFVYADRQEPASVTIIQTAPNNAAPAGNKSAPKPAASVAKPAPPANKPAPPANKPASPVNRPAPITTIQPIVQPYMNGPESEKGQHEKAPRISAYRFAVSLMQYDVISFDIFDTLILRKLNQPKDVFMLVGAKLDIFDFYNIRIRSEVEAREIKNASRGTREVTLDDIYKRVEFYTGVDPKVGAEIEFNIELDMCFANPYMKTVFEMVKAMGKQVCITSDMYLPKERMSVLLNNCGITGYDDILISCDYRCNKGSGDLFNVLISRVGSDKKIIHIGDNFAGEIKTARNAGIVATHYPSCRALGDVHRAKIGSPLIASAYCGLVNNTLHNGTDTYNHLWEFGFVYGGLATLGYVNWIHQKALQDKADKILFLARDGLVFKEVYDMLYHDIPSEYVFWSRVAAMRNISIEDREYLLSRLIRMRTNSGDTVADLIDTLGCKDVKDILKKNKLSSDTPITSNNMRLICNVIVENWDKLEYVLNDSRQITEEYIGKLVKGCEKIVIVDIGFSGHNTSPLVKIIEKFGLSSRNIKLYLMGNEMLQENSSQILSEYISCYMYNSNLNPDIKAKIISNGMVNHGIFEKLFSAEHPSFRGFDKDGEMEFAPSEAENRRGVIAIQEGIIAFCKKYINAFSKYPDMFNISGYDAFAPLNVLSDNPAYVSKIIGNFVQTFAVSLRDQRVFNSVFLDNGGQK